MQCGFQLTWQLIIFIAILLWMAQSLVKAVERVMAPDAWIICTRFRVKIWGGGERHYKSKQISLVSRFEDRLPPTHTPRTNALSKREQMALLLAAPENLLPCTVPAALVWASSATWKREASKQFFLFFSFFSLICYFFHIHTPPPPYFVSLKCSFPTSEAQTHVNHDLNDKDSFIFIECYVYFNRNWRAFIHFISQLLWIYIGICFLIKFFVCFLTR